MKRFTLAIVFASLLLAGCKDESIDFGGGGNGETEIGYLSLSALEVDVANYAEEITSGTGAGGAQSSRAAGATSDAPGDYKVKIRSVKSGEESVYTYADLKLAGNQKPLRRERMSCRPNRLTMRTIWRGRRVRIGSVPFISVP